MTAILNHRLVEALVRSGFTENDARVLVYITEHKNCTPNDMIRDLDMSQSYVSISTQKLYTRGLVTKTRYPGSEAKAGRLPCLYAVDKQHIRKFFNSYFQAREEALVHDRHTVTSYLSEVCE